MAWRCRFLTAPPSQDGRVIAEKWLSEELSGAPDALVDFHTAQRVDDVSVPQRHPPPRQAVKVPRSVPAATPVPVALPHEQDGDAANDRPEPFIGEVKPQYDKLDDQRDKQRGVGLRDAVEPERTACVEGHGLEATQSVLAGLVRGHEVEVADGARERRDAGESCAHQQRERLPACGEINE